MADCQRGGGLLAESTGRAANGFGSLTKPVTRAETLALKRRRSDAARLEVSVSPSALERR
jgi:hypothetical protein